MRVGHAALGTVLAATLGVAGAHGCAASSSATAMTFDGGTGRIAPDAAVAPSTADGSVDASPADQAVPPPLADAGVPEGWVPYQDYGACGFYVPTSPASLPPPIAWQPCASELSQGGLACQQMAVDWPAPTRSGTWSSLSAGAAWVQSDGTVTLQVTRFTGDWIYRIVADADGAVHQAVLETNPECTLGLTDVHDSNVVYHAYDLDGQGHEIGGGAVGGGIDDLRPKAYLHYHGAQNSQGHDYVAGGPSFLQYGNGGTNLYSWTDGSLLRSIAPSGLGYSYQGDAILWSSLSHTVYVNTPAGGTQSLVTFGNDWMQGADDVATDGTSLVWDEASGRSDPNQPFPVVSVMTAPYTTDPTQLQKRRLRSETPLTFSMAEPVVGCGYAAHWIETTGPAYGIRVIRLSDGWSWTLLAPASAPVGWQGPLGITCQEIFARVLLKPQLTVVRVRLDSLGPGTAPD